MRLRGLNIVLVVIILLAWTFQVPAQNVYKFTERIDSVLTVKYLKVDIDTNYVIRPSTKWTLKGRLNVSGAIIKAEGQKNDNHYKSELKADYKSTLSVGVSYLGLTINISFNPAKLLGKYRDFELFIQSYKPRIGFDISYQDAHNFQGWYNVGNVHHEIVTNNDIFKLRTLNANVYYVFNNRRFSYPAALVHNYIQRRSAGSFIIAVSGQGQHGRIKSDTINTDFKMTNIGIGAGYGYNYVPANGWLFHLSALPTFIVYSNTSITLDNTDIPLKYLFPEVIITARGAIVKQIGRNKFVGFSMVYYFTNIGDRSHLYIDNQKWLSRIYFGFRL